MTSGDASLLNWLTDQFVLWLGFVMQSSWIFSPHTRAVWLRTLVVIVLGAVMMSPALFLR